MSEAAAHFQPPLGHRPRPRLIRRLQERLADFRQKPQTLPSLNWAPLPGGVPRQRSMYVQRREACITVLQALVHYVDLVTLRIGCKGDDVCGVKLNTIVEQSGLNERRVDRAIRDLRAAGILRSFKRSQMTGEGNHIGRTSVRVILKELWYAFGLGDELARARKKRSQAMPKPSKRQRARQAMSLKSILSNLGQSPPSTA